MCKLPTQLHSRPQSMAFTAPRNWPHYVEISYTEFHPKAANLQRQDAFNQTVPVPQSTNASCTEFHENLTISFVADTASLQMDVDSQ
jgi:hypothetical protein